MYTRTAAMKSKHTLIKYGEVLIEMRPVETGQVRESAKKSASTHTSRLFQFIDHIAVSLLTRYIDLWSNATKPAAVRPFLFFFSIPIGSIGFLLLLLNESLDACVFFFFFRSRLVYFHSFIFKLNMCIICVCSSSHFLCLPSVYARVCVCVCGASVFSRSLHLVRQHFA